jgi:enamidase
VHVTHAVEEQQDVFTPWLRSGVTTVVDNGTLPEFVASLPSQVDSLANQSPRLFRAGPILTTPGGFPFTVGLEGLAINGPEDGQMKVESLIDEQGVDFIKVALEAGFGTDLDSPDWPVLAPETLAAIAEAANARGKTARIHVTHPQEFAAALDAGFGVIAHMPIAPMPSDMLQRAADADVIVVSTASFWGPPFSVTAAENLSRYIGLGGRIALGSDAGTFPLFGGVGEMPLAEMESLVVEGGLTPAEVLVAATKHAAESINRGDDLGTLEPGKLADVIVVAGDPLSDIGDMANVFVVIRDGEVILGG